MQTEGNDCFHCLLHHKLATAEVKTCFERKTLVWRSQDFLSAWLQGICSTAQMVNTPPPVILTWKATLPLCLTHPGVGLPSRFHSEASHLIWRTSALLLAAVWEISAALVGFFSNTMGLGGTWDAYVPKIIKLKITGNVSFQRWWPAGSGSVIDPITDSLMVLTMQCPFISFFGKNTKSSELYYNLYVQMRSQIFTMWFCPPLLRLMIC